MNPVLRHPSTNRAIEALEYIERMADMGGRGTDPFQALRAIREAALAGLGRPLHQEPPAAKRLRVRVTGAHETTVWYAGSIGSEFEVVEWGRDYVLACDYDRGHEAAWFHINKSDAEVIRP